MGLFDIDDNKVDGLDHKRNFSKIQIQWALQKQKYKCAHCGKKLDLSTPYTGDHKKPWIEGGRTVKENCQVLCLDCDRKKTNKDKLKKMEKSHIKKSNSSSIFYESLKQNKKGRTKADDPLEMIWGKQPKPSKKKAVDPVEMIWGKQPKSSKSKSNDPLDFIYGKQPKPSRKNRNPLDDFKIF
jgi:hypothetical protein